MGNSVEILQNIHIDIEELLEELRFDYQHSPNYLTNPNAFSNVNRTSGDFYMCCCPNHPETRASFGVSKDAPYNTNCFYCGYLGTIAEAIEIAFSLEEGEGIAKILTRYVVEEKRKVHDIVGMIKDMRGETKIPSLPMEELTKFDNVDFNSWDYRVGLAYMVNQRFITMHTLNTFQVKVDVENNCIVFPQFTRKGELRFLQKRKTGDSYSGAKFINEGLAIKRDILYGLHHIDALKTTPSAIKRIRMVESPIDVLSNYQVGIPAVAINGKILFSSQVRELQLAGIEVVDLFFDNDEAGRDATTRAIKILKRANIHVNVVLHPPHLAGSKQDSNSLLPLGLLDKLYVKDVTSFER